MSVCQPCFLARDEVNGAPRNFFCIHLHSSESHYFTSLELNETCNLHTTLQLRLIYLPSNNTPSSPHECNATIVQSPVKLLGCFSHQHEALSIWNNLWCIQSLLKQSKCVKQYFRLYFYHSLSHFPKSDWLLSLTVHEVTIAVSSKRLESFCNNITFLICSMNSFLSPVYFVVDGPLSWLLALTRSVWSEDRQRANTDSPGVGKEKITCYWGGRVEFMA